MFMRRALEIGKLVGFAAEGVIAVCFAVETIKKFITDRKVKNTNNDKGQANVTAAPATN